MKQRDSSIELLRIIAMLMIVLNHYSTHGGFNLSDVPMSLNKYVLSVVKWGEWAVNIFVLIFGYFSVKSKFKLGRIIRLYAQVWFYSVGIIVIYTLWNQEIHLGIIIRSIMPIISTQYWFFSKYILLCLLMPFLNIFILNLSRNHHLHLIIILLTVWCTLESVLPKFIGYDLGENTFGSIRVFTLLYLIGAYMRLYPNCKVCSTKIGWFITLSSICIMMSIKLINCRYPTSVLNIDCFSTSSILSTGFAVGMLTIFKNLGIKQNKIINGIAACTFGVYLIHDNDYMRPFLWHYVLKNSEYQSSPYMIVHMLISVIAVFVICTIIEFIRKQTIEKLWIRFGEPFILTHLPFGNKSNE